MPTGIVYLNGSSSKRDETFKILQTLLYGKSGDLLLNRYVILNNVFASFGGSDFVIELWGSNIEVIKDTVICIRNMVEHITKDENVETSTIICINPSESQNPLLSFNPNKLKSETQFHYKSVKQLQLNEIGVKTSEVKNATEILLGNFKLEERDDECCEFLSKYFSD